MYVKEEKLGIEIRATKLFAVKPGDFVYNRLFAWKGSFAVAQPEHEGCLVSNEFPCFELDRERISPKFLWLYFSRESAWLEALGLSSGSTPTSRNRLKEGQFLQMQIPLPPLDEQRRIVARVEELAALINEAQDLRAKAREEAGGLLASASFQLFSTAAVSSSNRAIGDTISFRSDLIRPTDGESGPLRFVGLQHIESHTGRRIGEDRLLAEELGGRKFRFSPREIVYGYLRPYLNKVWIADCEGVCSVDQYVI
ncbi:MAG: restriction endonuclease subunit S [Anaerolineae bacterium]